MSPSAGCDAIVVRRRWACIRMAFEGFHQYPAAPEEVAFLRALHRHLFVVAISIEQFNDDRDVEYILFKRWLEHEVAAANFPHHSSCEDIARYLGARILRAHPGRRLQVEVTEDGENGARLEFEAAEGVV